MPLVFYRCGNYLARILRAEAAGILNMNEPQKIHIWHEDSCLIDEGGLCDCDPQITIKKGDQTFILRNDGRLVSVQ